MITLNTHGFSSLSSHNANLNIKDLELIQYRRTYNDGYSFNFISGLEHANDFKCLNYSNIYLSNKMLLDTAIKYDIQDVSETSTILYTTLAYGSSYIKIVDIDPGPYKENDRIYEAEYYKALTFVDNEKEADIFNIIINRDNKCYIKTKKNGTDYILTYSDSESKFIFADSSKFSLRNDINTPFKFHILYNPESSYIFLSLLADQIYNIYKSGNKLTVFPAVSGKNNTILSSKIKINNNVNNISEMELNTSVVSYDTDGVNIDPNKIDNQIHSNYILIKSGDLRYNNFDIIQLKNIVNTRETITSNNSLVSSVDYSVDLYSKNNREYTSICDPIPQEETEDITLSYVFSNQDIYIHQQETVFTTSISLLPFIKININDTKFVDCGAFSSLIPEYADKVYKFSHNTPIEGQVYLCTWLSGAPIGDNKIWVDRYYYPDQISRQEALSIASNPINNDEYLDILLSSNSHPIAIPYFDKKSDLTFEPETLYKYERADISTSKAISGLNYCDEFYDSSLSIDAIKNMPYSYYNRINDSGSMIIAFKFNNNGKDFSVVSQRAAVDGGLSIHKNNNIITFIYKYFNPGLQSISTFEYEYESIDIQQSDLVFGLNGRTGEGKLLINMKEVYSFNIPAQESTDKMVLFGDIDVSIIDSNEKTTTTDFIVYNKLGDQTITDLFLHTDVFRYVDFVQFSIYRYGLQLEPITISIPCGMRNNIDMITSINNLCYNQGSKSNLIDIDIKNVSVGTELYDDIRNHILLESKKWLPVNTHINNLTFNTYK